MKKESQQVKTQFIHLQAAENMKRQFYLSIIRFFVLANETKFLMEAILTHICSCRLG